MKILRVKKTSIFDVFRGQGWGVWSRYFVAKDKTFHVNGHVLREHELRELKEVVKTWN